LNAPHHDAPLAARRGRRRLRRGPGAERRPHAIPLTEEGVPAATAESPRPSPVVDVTRESRALYPWIPARVIAGSVWRGPAHVRVRVDETGAARPWKCGPVAAMAAATAG
jgi:hypothetical protein